MQKLKTKWFSKWAKKQKISDDKLLSAIEDMQHNLSSVNLGGGLFKVRISSQSTGKSSGFRTIIVYRKDYRAVVVYGFKKNGQDNLTTDELKSFKILSKDILILTSKELDVAIEKSVFIPIRR